MANTENKSNIYRNIVRINHLILSLFLAIFFIYAGTKKFIPRPAPPVVNNEEFLKAFGENRFESPVTFKMAVKALKTSKFLLMVGVLQILSGILIIIPHTRLMGLLMLLPLTVNVFCFHYFMDNRPDENVETGILLALNMLLLVFYHAKLRSLVIKDWAVKFTRTV